MLEMELKLELDSVYDLSGGQASAVVRVLPLLWALASISYSCFSTAADRALQLSVTLSATITITALLRLNLQQLYRLQTGHRLAQADLWKYLIR